MAHKLDAAKVAAQRSLHITQAAEQNDGQLGKYHQLTMNTGLLRPLGVPLINALQKVLEH